MEEIAGEIRHLTSCSSLAAFRMACGLSQPEVVERFAKTSPSAVMDQPLLSRIEGFPGAGSRSPQATHIIALATLYGTSPLRLMDPDALDRLEDHERAVLLRCNAAFASYTPAEPPAPRSISEAVSPISTMTSRSRLIPATEHLERQVEMAARRALRFSVTVEGSNVGPETLDQLRDEVSRIAAAYPQQPLAVLLGDLIELQDVAFRLLEGRQRPSETTELYLLAGAISGMLAKASHDLGDPHSAMAQARTGYVCADNARHDGLRAWTRGLQSMVAYWAGWPNDAVRYAQLGQDAAASAQGTSSVWLAAQEARGWAVLGDADQTHAAIGRATDARDQTTPDELDQLGGIMTFSRPRQLYYEADALVWLPGAEAAAAQAASAAVTAYENAEPGERSFSDEAGSRADLALARINSGDLDGAAEALSDVFSLPVDHRIGGILASVRRVHEALRTPTHRTSPTARTTQLEIEAFCQIPASAALPPAR
ncbi:helix-turn-helix transcriptional regulator [Actinocorallia longicatena]|uniref:XRE family transcriptional regulator n=1 Tax=Actinocorallia longicatena TaxID=111803 RepID=A0ABP6QD31_9ACTN